MKALKKHNAKGSPQPIPIRMDTFPSVVDSAANDDVAITGDLPRIVPVIAQEIALLRSFLSEEINTILDMDET